MFTNPQKVNEASRELRQEAGKWLCSVRQAQGLVQRDVASALGLRYYTHYAQMESGVGRVPAERYHLLAAALGLDERMLTCRLMRAYDPETFALLFGADKEDAAEDFDEFADTLGQPMREPVEVPRYSSEDAKELRAAAGRWLRDRREAKGLSQTDVANTLGYKFYTRISQIERGIGRVPPEDARAYAEAVGVPPRDFAGMLLKCYDPMVHHLAFPAEGGALPSPAMCDTGPVMAG